MSSAFALTSSVFINVMNYSFARDTKICKEKICIKKTHKKSLIDFKLNFRWNEEKIWLQADFVQPSLQGWWLMS